MERFSMGACIGVAVLSFAGCASPAVECPKARTPEPAEHAEVRGEALVSVDYRIARSGTSDAVLVSGRSDVDRDRSAIVDHDAAREGSEKLVLHAEPIADGSIRVTFDWEERSEPGKVLRWSPTLSLQPGVAGTAKLDLPGGEGRTLVVTAEPAGRPRAQASAAP